MARYTGPTSKIARKFNDPIFGACKELKKKAYPPGQHGKNRRRKQSEYAIQLAAKQKAKYTYGVLERQFRNIFEKAAKKSGITGTNLLQFLEARLDNTVYRLGFAPTRRAARQLVSHKHITVNGKVVNIPSYTLKAGDVVGIRAKSQTNKVIKEATTGKQRTAYSWLEYNAQDLTGKYVQNPERDEIPENIQEQLIVELYSK
ncbi:30S ribosomal protein S4 [Flammeovirga yaeyamensis]|uniref:Small ribosomal subunit protein uS4 n=1 Tax=Flammeovirga yaeyamensis TaxID=367791 RepID=A0AAX1N6R9_9BACT|nr:30S ribosomal protein S4 [Flammeovirga yaeyamensis]MBB3701111.1 small subunit ribosomal protein S4 [Flammeovirga yaeyamensis]NMF38422.1 30S ribosomal protein S4 [Flammeovirga yaeyamensis]QWG01578.1 30S ribosomal protein S4 [Flammeovirga yaeyamensis]